MLIIPGPRRVLSLWGYSISSVKSVLHHPPPELGVRILCKVQHWQYPRSISTFLDFPRGIRMKIRNDGLQEEATYEKMSLQGVVAYENPFPLLFFCSLPSVLILILLYWYCLGRRELILIGFLEFLYSLLAIIIWNSFLFNIVNKS